MRWRLIDLAAWVWETFGISVSEATLSRELKTLGYSKLSARPRHHAQSEERIVAFKDARKGGGSIPFRIRQVEFQRATLLELQDVVGKPARFTVQVHFYDLSQLRGSGTWRLQSVSEEVKEGFLLSQRDLTQLRVRVRDDTVRERGDVVSETRRGIILATSESESRQAMSSALNARNELNERIGTILHSLDDEEDGLLSQSVSPVPASQHFYNRNRYQSARRQ